MWKIGPECAAQQPKKVSARTTNCGERSACDTVPAVPGATLRADSGPTAATTGGWRTSNAAGISRIQAMMPIVIMAVRQSYVEINHRANGETVIGATPIPAETNETARLRLLSNHIVAAAIIGA